MDINTVYLVGILVLGSLAFTWIAIKTKTTMVTFLTISAIILFAMILGSLFASDVLGFVVEDSYRDLLNIMIGAFLTYFNLIIRHHVRGSEDQRDPDKRTRKTDHQKPTPRPQQPVNPKPQQQRPPKT